MQPGSLGKDAHSSVIVAIILIVALIAAAIIVIVGFGLFTPAPSTAQSIVSANSSTGTILTLGGSTTVQPVSELITKAYSREHPDISFSIVGGGSGAGITKTASGEFDIGASSRSLEADEESKYPALQVHRIGGSAIVVIANRNLAIDVISYRDLQALYNATNDDLTGFTDIADIDTVVQRSDASGTEEVFAQWLYGSSVKDVNGALTIQDTNRNGPVRPIVAEGNAGVLKTVKENKNSIGFVDFGYAEADTGVKILRIADKGSSQPLPLDLKNIRASILSQLSQHSGENAGYIARLTRPLLYITNGTPTQGEREFISYAESDAAQKYFNEVGYFSISEINQASGSSASG
jgi:phosphate transport system substrate-binding protein